MKLHDRKRDGQTASPVCLPARNVLTVSIAALLLAGCADAPSDMTEMRAAITTRLAEGATDGREGAAARVALSQGFGPALAAAVRANDGYRGALALEREASGLIGVAASVRAPQLSANAGLGGVVTFERAADTTSGLSGGVNLSQLVYDGGGSTASINRATAQALSAQAGREVQGNEIALNAARAWVDLWQYSARLNLLRARVAETEGLVAQIDRMATTGMIDRAALDSARRKIVDLSLEETRLEASRAEAGLAFQRFFNSAPRDVGRPADLISPAQARAMAQNWQSSPLLQRQAAEALAAHAAVGEAQAAFRPQVRLQAGARAPMERDGTADMSVGMSLEYTFGDGGRRQRQLESAEARRDATEAQLTDAQRSLQSELAVSVARLASAERSAPLVEERLRLSRSEAATARSQLQTGQTDLRQLVEAELETYRAEDQRIALQAERQLLLLTIASRTGRLGAVIGLEDTLVQ